MRQVESWSVVAVSDEFLKILDDIPEAALASSVRIGKRVIEGPKCVLKARSMEEIELNLPAIVEQLTDKDHTHLQIIHKRGTCYDCKLKAGEDPNIPSTDCPHVGGPMNGLVNRVSAIVTTWTIDTKTLQKSRA